MARSVQHWYTQNKENVVLVPEFGLFHLLGFLSGPIFQQQYKFMLLFSLVKNSLCIYTLFTSTLV